MSNKLENEMNLNNNYGLNIILNSLKNFLTTKIENLDFSTTYLYQKNDFLNYEKSDILHNFDKLNEIGFFKKEPFTGI